jgi:hypothetical protein
MKIKTINPYFVMIALAITIVIAFVIYRLYKKFFQSPVNAEILQYAEKPKKTDREIENITSEMYDAISGIFTLADTKNEIAKKVMDCNDNDIIRIYNYWNEKFSKGIISDNGTLYIAMKDEKNVPFISVGERDYWHELIARLERLKLS